MNESHRGDHRAAPAGTRFDAISDPSSGHPSPPRIGVDIAMVPVAENLATADHGFDARCEPQLRRSVSIESTTA